MLKETNYFFTAPWCNICKLVKPTIMKLIEEGKEITIVDMDTEEELATKLDVLALPTLIVGEKRLSGSMHEDDIIKLFE